MTKPQEVHFMVVKKPTGLFSAFVLRQGVWAAPTLDIPAFEADTADEAVDGLKEKVLRMLGRERVRFIEA